MRATSIRQSLMHYAKKPNTVNHLNIPIVLLFPTDHLRQSPLKSCNTYLLATPKIRKKVKVLKSPKPSRPLFNHLIHSKTKVLAVMMISHDGGLVPGPLDPGSVAVDALWVEARFSIPLAVEPTGSLAVVVELDVDPVVETVVP